MAAIIEWSDDFNIGLPRLDADHLGLVRRINDLQRAVGGGQPPARLLGKADALVARFRRHVAAEERYLVRLNSPAGRDHRDSHRAAHALVLRRLQALRDRLEQGGDAGPELDAVALDLTVTELIRTDFDLVGLLHREGLSPPGAGGLAAAE